MKIQLVLCILFLVLVSQTALTQDDPVEQEARFTKIEVTLKHLNETMGNVDARLDNILFAIMGLFAAFFIPIFILILQIKTQLRDLGHDIGTLKDQVSGLESRVSGLEGKVDGLEEQVVQNRKQLMEHITELSVTTQKQLNQIRDALAVQFGIVLEPEDED